MSDPLTRAPGGDLASAGQVQRVLDSHRGLMWSAIGILAGAICAVAAVTLGGAVGTDAAVILGAVISGLGTLLAGGSGIAGAILSYRIHKAIDGSGATALIMLFAGMFMGCLSLLPMAIAHYSATSWLRERGLRSSLSGPERTGAGWPARAWQEGRALSGAQRRLYAVADAHQKLSWSVLISFLSVPMVVAGAAFFAAVEAVGLSAQGLMAMVGVQLAGGLLVSLGASLLGLLYSFRVIQEVERSKGAAIAVTAVGFLMGCGALPALFYAHHRGGRFLRERGVRTGWMGANEEQIAGLLEGE